MSTPPVLDDWNAYVFPEDGLRPGSERLLVKDPIPPSPGMFSPGNIDRGKASRDEGMKATLLQVSARIAHPDHVAALEWPNGSTLRWFLFSPYEVFLEEVLSQELKTIEPGDLR